MSQVIEQALHEANRLPNLDTTKTRPVILLPVLPSTAVDQIFQRFGFKPNSRTHLIKQGLFPKGASLRGRAMTTSLYPSLVVDLIALLARQQTQNQLVADRLRQELEELLLTPLFEEVLHSLVKLLPVGQPVTLAYISRLFWPTPRLILPAHSGEISQLKLDWFERINYSTRQSWYRLALVQQQLRRVLFMPENKTSALVAAPVTQILTGYVDGDNHSPPGYMKVLLRYGFNSSETASLSGYELGYDEELELNSQTLEWLGCAISDAPIARLEARLDQFDSRLLFFLPGFEPPDNYLSLEQWEEVLEKGTVKLPTLPGFVDTPLSEQELAEIEAELDREGY
jgi:hypothetical protein